jgi:hypothetical protein
LTACTPRPIYASKSFIAKENVQNSARRPE